MPSFHIFLRLCAFLALVMAIPKRAISSFFGSFSLFFASTLAAFHFLLLSQHAFRCTRMRIGGCDGQFRPVWDFLGLQKDGCWHRFGWCAGSHLSGFFKPRYLSKLFQTCFLTYVSTIKMHCGTFVCPGVVRRHVTFNKVLILAKMSILWQIPPRKFNSDSRFGFYASILPLGVGVMLNLFQKKSLSRGQWGFWGRFTYV